MKNLFIIDGAAGTGKSDLLKYLLREKQKTAIITKVTTREKRIEEEDEDYILDLEFDKQEFLRLSYSKDFYKYGYGNEQYGFSKTELENKLSSNDNVFIIIRNNDLVKILRKDFPYVRIIFVYIYSDIVEVEKRLKSIGYDSKKIKFRLQRNNTAWNDYVKHSKDYDEILINNSNTTDYEKLIDQLINKYNQSNNDRIEVTYKDKFQLIKPLIGHKDEIEKMFEKYAYERNVFLMMRYRPYNEHLFKHIEKIINENGFNCVRADMSDWNITQNVYNPIAVLYACKYGIALFDLPEGDKDKNNQYNPNITYELGMMHLQKKECLVLMHADLDNLPFDIIKDLYKSYKYQQDITPHLINWIETKLKK